MSPAHAPAEQPSGREEDGEAGSKPWGDDGTHRRMLPRIGAASHPLSPSGTEPRRRVAMLPSPAAPTRLSARLRPWRSSTSTAQPLLTVALSTRHRSRPSARYTRGAIMGNETPAAAAIACASTDTSSAVMRVGRGGGGSGHPSSQRSQVQVRFAKRVTRFLPHQRAAWPAVSTACSVRLAQPFLLSSAAATQSGVTERMFYVGVYLRQ